jgi:alkanesulfonate monooxygenase SsuD/methylene tetrahydromethanopterin reductase-like flavin-dependent oxidoreductase (luciferase family)
MTLQLLLLGDAPVAQLVERAKLAEANGYSTVWVADERFYREVYSCLGQLAVHTSKVLLGPCVTDPFARHPALTAMAIGTLDEISGGRAILGIGAGRLRSRTATAQGLSLPPEALAAVAGAAYAAGATPYLRLLPLITDRHVDAFTLAGTVDEVVEHAIALHEAGVDGVIARPFAAEGGTIEQTIATLGSEVWPRVLG